MSLLLPVLWIDDDAPRLPPSRAVSRVLKADIRTVSTVSAALDLLLHEQFAVIVTDLMIPWGGASILPEGIREEVADASLLHPGPPGLELIRWLRCGTQHIKPRPLQAIIAYSMIPPHEVARPTKDGWTIGHLPGLPVALLSKDQILFPELIDYARKELNKRRHGG